MVKVAIPIVLFALVAAGRADQGDKPKRPESLVRLVDAAAAFPPELAADTLLAVIESGKIAERKWQLEILEDAFRIAANAKHELPVVAVVPDARNTDSDAGMLARSLRGGLTRIALQCRAINRMLDLDRSRAVEMFLSMSPPRISPIGCRDAVESNPQVYFDTAYNLVQRGFTPKERRDGEDFQLVQQVLGRVSSFEELAPAAELIVKIGGRRLTELSNTLAAALSRMDASDRSVGEAPGLVSDHVLELAKSCARNSGSADPIVRAWRECVMRVLHGTRCAENAAQKDRSPEAQLIQDFNGKLAPLAPAVALIAADDMKPVEIGDAARVTEFWTSAEARRLLQEFKEVRFGPPKQGEDSAARPSMKDLLADFAKWTSDEGESLTVFHESSMLHAGLLQDVQDDNDWRGVLQSYVELLRQNRFENEDPPQWYLQFSRLMELAPKTQPEARRKLIRQDAGASGDGLMFQLVERGRILGPK